MEMIMVTHIRVCINRHLELQNNQQVIIVFKLLITIRETQDQGIHRKS